MRNVGQGGWAFVVMLIFFLSLPNGVRSFLGSKHPSPFQMRAMVPGVVRVSGFCVTHAHKHARTRTHLHLRSLRASCARTTASFEHMGNSPHIRTRTHNLLLLKQEHTHTSSIHPHTPRTLPMAPRRVAEHIPYSAHTLFLSVCE